MSEVPLYAPPQHLSGFRIRGSGSRVGGSGFGVQGVGCRLGLEFRVQGLGQCFCGCARVVKVQTIV